MYVYYIIHIITYDAVLKELPTKVNYNNFDHGDASCKYSPFYTSAKSLIDKQNWNEDVSNKILNALCYAHNKNKSKEFNDADCDYLYFWLGDIIYRNLTYRNSFYTVMNSFKFILEGILCLSKCNFVNYNTIEHNFMDIKSLFDFSNDYDKLDEYFSTHKRTCSTKINNYIKPYIMSYTMFKNKCKDLHRKDETCMAFNKYFKDSNKIDLRKLSCNSVNNIARYATQQQNHREGANTHVRKMVQITEARPHIHERVRGVKAKGDVTISDYEGMLHQSVDQGGHVNVYQESIMHKHSENSHLDVEKLEFKDNPGTSSHPSAFSSSESMVIAPLFIGITIFSIIFCKFTPVGYWLKKSIFGKSKRKRNIIRNMNITDDYTMPEDIQSSRRFNVTFSNIY
ncbi:variable surface protein [Plasmodium gonderi]|uniref:Variable surface protein n=1 Tax=Plasmodium gonderi TaxID=77519 RepID=A0A1Y1JT59_PLAGO|nr:variable surface protein [Plasmodium gonderi]GAW83972.1 variable surface protein [Plasmodium gonderi]